MQTPNRASGEAHDASKTVNAASLQERCARCGRFVGEEALEGWSGGLFGDYNGKFYCAFGVGCNSVESAAGREADPLVLGKS